MLDRPNPIVQSHVCPRFRPTSLWPPKTSSDQPHLLLFWLQQTTTILEISKIITSWCFMPQKTNSHLLFRLTIYFSMSRSNQFPLSSLSFCGGCTGQPAAPSHIFDLQDVQGWDLRHHLRQQPGLRGRAEDFGHALGVVLDLALPAPLPPGRKALDAGPGDGTCHTWKFVCWWNWWNDDEFWWFDDDFYRCSVKMPGGSGIHTRPMKRRLPSVRTDDKKGFGDKMYERITTMELHHQIF